MNAFATRFGGVASQMGLVSVLAPPLLWTGCGEDTSLDPYVQIDPPVDETPEIDTIASPEPLVEKPLPTFQVLLEPGSQARLAYQILLQAGVTNDALDLGCDREDPTGRHDRVIEACEVQEYALAHYLEYPAAAEAIFGGIVPWSLDDFNPETTYDADLRQQVDATLQALRTSDSVKTLDADSDAYRSKLALGLFYFIDFPREVNFSKAEENHLKIRTAKLRAEGLGDFQDYLFEHGGLGTSALPVASMQRISTNGHGLYSG